MNTAMNTITTIKRGRALTPSLSSLRKGVASLIILRKRVLLEAPMTAITAVARRQLIAASRERYRDATRGARLRIVDELVS